MLCLQQLSLTSTYPRDGLIVVDSIMKDVSTSSTQAGWYLEELCPRVLRISEDSRERSTFRDS